MSTQTNDRRNNVSPLKAKSSLARRVTRAAGIKGQRVVARCFDFVGITQRQGAARIRSIEEAIARVVADNPPQLYRGGA